MKVIQNDSTTFELHIDSAMYNTAVLHKCFYWYSDKFSIDIDRQKENTIVTLSNVPEDLVFEEVLVKIKKDLIDFKTRDIVATETSSIRALLTAKAFANSDEYDELPPGSVEDPAGFEVSDY